MGLVYLAAPSFSGWHSSSGNRIGSALDIEKLTPTYQNTKAALLNGDICLHYQPIHCLRTGNLLGYEALARWGKMPPLMIAEIVESHSLELTWVRQQLADVDLILARTYPPIWISLNVNQRVLALEPLPFLLNTSPHQLGIHVELLESVQLTPSAIAAIEKIQHRHIVKADDIGSLDYAWFNRLVGKYAPYFHGIKLCQALIQDITTDLRTAAACKLFIGFAKSQGLEITCEWVETVEQRDLLIEWGADNGQGALYGLAMPWEFWQQKHPQP